MLRRCAALKDKQATWMRRERARFAEWRIRNEAGHKASGPAEHCLAGVRRGAVRMHNAARDIYIEARGVSD